MKRRTQRVRLSERTLAERLHRDGATWSDAPPPQLQWRILDRIAEASQDECIDGSRNRRALFGRLGLAALAVAGVVIASQMVNPTDQPQYAGADAREAPEADHADDDSGAVQLMNATGGPRLMAPETALVAEFKALARVGDRLFDNTVGAMSRIPGIGGNEADNDRPR